MSATCRECTQLGRYEYPAHPAKWMIQLCPLHAHAEALREALIEYQFAATKFIEKVESGRAHSVETYRELKACQELATKALAATKTKETP